MVSYNLLICIILSLSKSNLKFRRIEFKSLKLTQLVFSISYIFKFLNKLNHDLTPLLTNFSLNYNITLEVFFTVSLDSLPLKVRALVEFMDLPFCLWSFLGKFLLYSLSSVPKGDTLDPYLLPFLPIDDP